jgi:hypothetical protein
MNKETIKSEVKKLLKEHFGFGGIICPGALNNPWPGKLSSSQPQERLPMLRRDFANVATGNSKLKEAIKRIAESVNKNKLKKEDLEEIAYKVIKSFRNESYASIITELKKQILNNGYKLIKEGMEETLVKEEGKGVDSDMKKLKPMIKSSLQWNAENPSHWLDKQNEDVTNAFWRVYNAFGLGD